VTRKFPGFPPSNPTLQPATVVGRLGILMNQRLSFHQHFDQICMTCYRHSRAFRHMRESLPDDFARTVACSIVTSRIDYCKSLSIRMSDANFAKLQRVQDTLVRTVLRLKRNGHITPALTELHWLPVHARVTFKVTSLTFKILKRQSPTYLFELLLPYQPT
jgi:hypothetical protein